jgi:hypothetical protein
MIDISGLEGKGVEPSDDIHLVFPSTTRIFLEEVLEGDSESEPVTSDVS